MLLRETNVRAVWPSVQPASRGLPRQQAGHLNNGPHAGPVDEHDGVAAVVKIHRALELLRRVRHNPVVLAATGIDVRRVQHVRAEVGDVNNDATAADTATGSESVSAAPGKSSEARRLLVARGPVADSPALHVRIEACGHCFPV